MYLSFFTVSSHSFFYSKALSSSLLLFIKQISNSLQSGFNFFFPTLLSKLQYFKVSEKKRTKNKFGAGIWHSSWALCISYHNDWVQVLDQSTFMSKCLTYMPPMWKTQIEFEVLDFGLNQSWILRTLRSYSADYSSLCLAICLAIRQVKIKK